MKHLVLGTSARSDDTLHSDSDFRSVSETRAPEMPLRLVGAAVIWLATSLLAPSIWPTIWFIAVVVLQGVERLLDNATSAPNFKETPRFAAAFLGLTFINSFLYVSIALILWVYSPYTQAFAVMITCSTVLHACLHLQAKRSVLIAGLLGQIPVVLGTSLFGLWGGGGVSGVVGTLVWLVSWVAYFGHLQTVIANARQSSEAFKAASVIAGERQMLAESASRSKSEFLATVSHEIRTPLNAVTSAAYLLDKTDLTPQQREFVSILLNGSDVLGNIINDVLDMSKIEAGKIAVELGDTDLGELTAKLSSFWSSKAAERGLNFKVQLDPSLPRSIWTDSLRLTQILSNLLSNAIKFTSSGSVRVSIHRDVTAELAEEGGQPLLCFHVVDTGPGMSQEVMSRLFQSFEQADVSVTKRFGGTGLGLSISRSLAELLGGTLEVDSQVGIGSTFKLTLPLIPGTVKSEPVTLPVSRLVVGPSGDETPLVILLAEDNPVNRRLVELFFQPLGWELHMAENGADAVELAQSRPFDVILMDMQMPVMSGLDATWAIRQGTGPNANTPIVALTANAFDDQRVAWEDAGAAGFVTKPINAELLIDTVRSLSLRAIPSFAGDLQLSVS